MTAFATPAQHDPYCVEGRVFNDTRHGEAKDDLNAQNYSIYFFETDPLSKERPGKSRYGC